MRFLVEFTTLNYKMWHSFAKHLNEIYPGSAFAAILSYAPEGDHCRQYLLKQKDIKYEFLEIWHERKKKFFDTEIDYEALRRFEESTPYKSLWRMLVADRNIASAFMHDAVWMRSYMSEMSTRDNILRYVSSLLKALTEVFDRFKPDVYLPAAAMGGTEVFVGEQICRERGIKIAVPATCRIEDIFSFTNDKYSHFPYINSVHEKLTSGQLHLDLSAADALYNKLVADFTNNQFFDRKNKCYQIKKLDTWADKLRFQIGTPGSLIKSTLQWFKESRLRASDDPRRQLNRWSHYFSNVRFAMTRRYHNYTHLLNPKFGTFPEQGDKYIYYPLHMSPEFSTQVQGTMWLDQVHLIESLAKSIPSDWLVYVKEHPATLGYRARPKDFYDRILHFPNVRIAPIDMDMHELIANAQMVAVITGTTGWEAILRGVPVINFGECAFDPLGLSRKVSNLTRLSNEIHDEIIRIKQISPAERKIRIIRFLAAIIEGGFRITYVQQYGYNAPATDEQFEHIGGELAVALSKYLKYFEGEKRNTVDLMKVN